ncbi:caspase domain-containing protein [Hypoxylon argillaceum]|nr:caspase domain-containing protein [Hypoxylon argillaceum]
MDGANPTANSAPSKWAVLVGIDRYSQSEPTLNLRGACNDAVLVYRFLSSNLGVPERNIRLHLARDPTFSGTAHDPPSTAATFWNFRGSLEHIRCQARAGDFVHIHFSGHGARAATLHKEEKPESEEDERLCFTDNEMTDVMFGEMLDNMAAAPCNLTILVTLDCCFSGGMTRHGSYSAVRNKPSTSLTSHCMNESSQRNSVPKSNHYRHANLKKGWLYRDRDYNVIAACQPHEKATEGPEAGTGSRIHGILTFNMISQLQLLGDKRPFITYNVFQEILGAVVRATSNHIIERQQPMLLGPRNRFLFESSVYDGNTWVACVRDVKPDFLVINMGSASGAKIDDVLYNSRKSKDKAATSSNSVLRVIIFTVREYESDARFCPEPSGSTMGYAKLVKPGWLATHVQRSKATEVQIIQSDLGISSAIVDSLRREWESFDDPVVPLCLRFPEDQINDTTKPVAEFYVHIYECGIRINGFDDKPIMNLPIIPIFKNESTSALDNTIRTLMRLLQHIQLYHEIETMRGPQSVSHAKPSFKLGVTEYERPDELSVVSSWEVSLHNFGTKTLFLTIFNLTGLHGIQQIFPADEGNGKAVVQGDSVSCIIDINVPAALLQQYTSDPSFEMRDILKMFITTEHVSLRHLQLDDITDNWIANPRHAKARPSMEETKISWWVEEKEIITQSNFSRTQ